jgi:integrase
MGLYTRGTRIWARYKGPGGKWEAAATPYSVGEETQAAAFFAQLTATMDARRRAAESVGVLTVAAYAAQWIERRRARGMRAAIDDEARLRLHALPVLGDMPLADVRPRHIRELVEGMRDAGTHAPRSVRHVYATLATMFRSAVAAEVIAATPCVLEAGTLPKKADQDPTWRRDAIFSRTEVEMLISSPLLLEDRRALYALKGLAALRHGEAARLTWGQVDLTREPLGRISLDKTKSGVPRAVPIHATLGAILAEWREAGWERVYGRAPRADDLVVPSRALRPRGAPETQVQLVADLERLGLPTRAGDVEGRRNRRGHDLRRTMISLALEDGARRDLLEVCTHGPRGDIISVYSTFPWPALCHEISRLCVRWVQPNPLQSVTASPRTRNRYAKMVTPSGLEAENHPTSHRVAASLTDGESRGVPSSEGVSGGAVVTSLVTTDGTAIAVAASIEGALVLGDAAEALRLTRVLRGLLEPRAVGFRPA